MSKSTSATLLRLSKKEIVLPMPQINEKLYKQAKH
jgi:hypothetical protein